MTKKITSVLELGEAVYSRFIGLNSQFSKSEEFIAFNARINRNRKTWESFVSEFKASHKWEKLNKAEKQKLLNFLDYIRKLCNVKARPKTKPIIDASADKAAAKSEKAVDIKSSLDLSTENSKRQYVLAVLDCVCRECKWTLSDTVHNILQYTATKGDILESKAIARKVNSIKSA